MLFTPAAINILGAVIGRATATSEKGMQAMVTGLITGPLGALICLGLGFWLARESTSLGWKILGAVLFGLSLHQPKPSTGKLSFLGC